MLSWWLLIHVLLTDCTRFNVQSLDLCQARSLIMVGQHGVYCNSSRNPSKPALDLQAVLSGMEDAKTLIQSVMEELERQRDAAAAEK